MEIWYAHKSYYCALCKYKSQYTWELHWPLVRCRVKLLWKYVICHVKINLNINVVFRGIYHHRRQGGICQKIWYDWMGGMLLSVLEALYFSWRYFRRLNCCDEVVILPRSTVYGRHSRIYNLAQIWMSWVLTKIFLNSLQMIHQQKERIRIAIYGLHGIHTIMSQEFEILYKTVTTPECQSRQT